MQWPAERIGTLLFRFLENLSVDFYQQKLHPFEHVPLTSKWQAQMEQLLLKKSYSQILNETLHNRVPTFSGLEYILWFKYSIVYHISLSFLFDIYKYIGECEKVDFIYQNKAHENK